MATVTLDLVGLKCPLPALRTKLALQKLKPGDRLAVRCTDPMAAIDIPHLINQTRNRLVEFTRNETELRFLIELKSI